MSGQAAAGGAPSPPVNYVAAARTADSVLLRVQGLGTMKNALGVWDFTEDMVERGYRRFCLDLSGCRGMDSTFMGTLVGLSSRLKDIGEGCVAVVNASRSTRDILEIVGADKFLDMRGKMNLEDVETEILPKGDAPLAKRIKLVRRAHEDLIEIDKRNEERFGAFLKALTAELKGS